MESQSTTTRHDRRRLETHARILDAAAALFGELGVQATKVTRICEAADVAQQTFFNHFPSKSDVVRELTVRAHDFFVSTIEEAHREGASTRERIALLFERVHDAATGMGPMHQELLSELTRAAQTDRAPERRHRVQGALEALVRSGVAEGDVTPRHHAEDLAELLFGAQHMLMLEWANRSDFPMAERSARMARLLADLLAPRPGRSAS